MGFVPFTFIDFIDIILVAAIMYWIYRATKGTNAPYIITGIIIIYLLWVVVKALNMTLLSSIMGQVIGVGVLALIIVFQQEVRRYLLLLGSQHVAIYRAVKFGFPELARSAMDKHIDFCANSCLQNRNLGEG